MKYIELFAGVGGFRLGIERAFDNSTEHTARDTASKNSHDATDQLERNPIPVCVLASEWDKYAAQTYNKNFGGEVDTRDITAISDTEIPAHDLLVGGFPCQTFSVAGKRAGFNETRGTMFFEIARILADKRPRHLVLENVKGLLSHDSGQTFQTILRVLSDLGYRAEWQVLNSKDFGVPQNRERIFIIGHLRDECTSKVLPIAGTGYTDTAARTIRASTGGLSERHTIVGGLQDHQKPRKDGISPTLTSAMGMGGGQVPILTVKLRQLTPVECERLQGFPDNWTEGISDSQRYKQMGNAVTVNVVKTVMMRLRESCL